MACLIVAQDTETASQGGHLRIPDRQICCQRIAEDDPWRIGAFGRHGLRIEVVIPARNAKNSGVASAYCHPCRLTSLCNPYPIGNLSSYRPDSCFDDVHRLKASYIAFRKMRNWDFRRRALFAPSADGSARLPGSGRSISCRVSDPERDSEIAERCPEFLGLHADLVELSGCENYANPCIRLECINCARRA